jgi:hypothetical protein
MPPDMVCNVFLITHLGNSKESIHKSGSIHTVDSATENDMIRLRVVFGRGDLQRNIDYNSQEAWHFTWPENSFFGRDKGFIL